MENGKYYSYHLINCNYCNLNLKYLGTSFLLEYEHELIKHRYFKSSQTVYCKAQLQGECIDGKLYDIVTGKEIRSVDSLNEDELNFKTNSKWLAYSKLREISVFDVKENLSFLDKDAVICYREYMDELESMPIKRYEKIYGNKDKEEQAKKYIKNFKETYQNNNK